MLNEAERKYFESLSWEKANPIRERHQAELSKFKPISAAGSSLAPHTSEVRRFTKELAEARIQAFIETYKRVSKYPDESEYKEFADELFRIVDHKGDNLPRHLKGAFSPFSSELVERIEEQLSAEIRQVTAIALSSLRHFINEGKLSPVTIQQDADLKKPLKENGRTSTVDIFISHSHKDGKYATAIINLLRAALNLPKEHIRCTGVDEYRLEPGTPVEPQLRREINDARAFIGIITEESVKSTYVLFELGARWGLERHLVPVLTSSKDEGLLKEPLKTYNPVRCDSAVQLHQLIDNIAKVLTVTPNNAASYHKELEALTRKAKSRRKQKPNQYGEPKQEVVAREASEAADNS